MSVVAILGSARGDGNAARLLDAVLAARTARRFDLGALCIGDYRYHRNAGGDDFLSVAQAMTAADALYSSRRFIGIP